MSKRTTKILASSLSAALVASMVTLPSVASAATSTQLAGLNRYETSLEIVQAGWDSSDNVIIASGESRNMADSLAAAPLAYKMGEAPILLTKTDSIPAGVLEELTSLGVKTITIVGGDNAVSPAVEAELKATGVTVERVFGADRFETSLAIAKAAFGTDATNVVIANGLASADALSVSSIAAYEGMPVLLVNNKTGLTAEQKAYIAGTTVYAVGGTTVLSDAVVGNATRLDGANRYETNAAILAKFAPDYSKIFLAKGTEANLVDALVGSAYAAKGNNPIVLVNSQDEINAKLATEVTKNIKTNSEIVSLGGKVITSTIDAVEAMKSQVLAIQSASAIGAKTLKVEFNKAVDTTKAVIAVKKGSVVLNGVVTFADDKMSATIVLPSNLVEADYVVTVTGLSDVALTSTISATAEEINKIEILADKALLNDGDVSVGVSIHNQYNEDITNNYDENDLVISTNVTTTSAGITLDDGKLTIESDGDAIEEDDRVVITILDSETGVSATKSLVASEESVVDVTTFVKMYQEDDEVLRTDSVATEYSLIVEAKDQYGNSITTPADLNEDIMVIMNDGGTNLTAGAFTYSDINDDDKDEVSMRLGDSAQLVDGTAIVTLLSKSTGEVTRINVKVEKAIQADTISIEAPELVVAGEDTELTFMVEDNEGNAVTDFDTLSAIDISANLDWEENYKDGSAKLVFLNTGATVAGTTIVTATTPSSNFESLKISYEDAAVPTVVSGIDEDVVTNVATTGSAITIELGDVLVNDQYGRDIDGVSVSVTDENGDAYATIDENNDLSVNPLTETGKETYTLAIVGEENSEFELTVNTVEKADITRYELATIGTIYEDGLEAVGVAGAYAQDLVVYGYTAADVKVEVPAAWYTVQTSTAGLNYEEEKIDADMTPDVDADNNISATVTVIVDADNAPVTLSQVVTVTGVAPEATTVDLEDVENSAEDLVLEVDEDVAYLDISNLDVLDLNDQLQAMLTAEDQYGVDFSGDAMITFTTLDEKDGTDLTRTANGSEDATLANIQTGDTFVVNFNLNGNTISTKVIAVD
jgi:putative cell wall-binding protein